MHASQRQRFRLIASIVLRFSLASLRANFETITIRQGVPWRLIDKVLLIYINWSASPPLTVDTW